MADQGLIPRVQHAAGRWRSALSVGGMLALYELGSRIGLPGVNGQAIHDFINAEQAGPIALYNLVAGGGTSRGALLALGIMPYITARVYLRLGRAVSSRIRERTETDEGKTRALRAMTLGVSVLQSAGYLTFISTIPNAIVGPGMWFTVRSVLLLSGGAAAASLLAEQLFKDRTDDDTIIVPPASVVVDATHPSPAPLLLVASSVPEVLSIVREKDRVSR